VPRDFIGHDVLALRLNFIFSLLFLLDSHLLKFILKLLSETSNSLLPALLSLYQGGIELYLTCRDLVNSKIVRKEILAFLHYKVINLLFDFIDVSDLIDVMA
jgi:hypothetical protein